MIAIGINTVFAIQLFIKSLSSMDSMKMEKLSAIIRAHPGEKTLNESHSLGNKRYGTNLYQFLYSKV